MGPTNLGDAWGKLNVSNTAFTELLDGYFFFSKSCSAE